jgi:hypothetical protein
MSLDEFTSKLAAAGKGALPDGEYLVTVIEVKTYDSGKFQVFAKTDGGRTVRKMYSAKQDPGPWIALLDQRVKAKVFRDPQGHQRTHFSPCDGTVAAFGGKRLTVEGEILTSNHPSTTRGSGEGVARGDVIAVPDEETNRDDECSGRATELSVQVSRREVGQPAASPSSIDPGALAYHRHQQLLQGLATTRLGLADIAEACHEIQVGKLWQQLGYDKLADYLADPDITLTRREFFRAAAIHEAYVLGAGVDADVLELAPASKWEAALPGASDPSVPADEVVEDVQTLGIQDLRVKYRGADESSADTHSERCEKCGQVIRRAA